MVRHFASLAEIVEDFEAAVRFYEDVLGLEVERLSDGYANVTVPGVLHFGIWSRAEAANATYGTATPQTAFRSASPSASRWTKWKKPWAVSAMPALKLCSPLRPSHGDR